MLSTVKAAGVASDKDLDCIFRALADPTRREILSRLADGSAMVTELAEPFDMSLPAVGKHLKVLEQAGLVKRTVNGRVHRCSLNATPLKDATQWLAHYEKFWDETLDALIDYVEDDSTHTANRQKRR